MPTHIGKNTLWTLSISTLPIVYSTAYSIGKDTACNMQCSNGQNTQYIIILDYPFTGNVTLSVTIV